MKFSTIASVLAVAGLCVSLSKAAEVTIGADVQSAYVASGTTCDDGPVVMPWIDIGGLKLGDTDLPISLGVWGNIDLDDGFGPVDETGAKSKIYKSRRFSEVDFNIGVDLGQYIAENLKFYIGYLEYDYPRLGDETDNLLDVKLGYDFASGETALFNASLRLKYRFGGNSEGKYEVFADINRDFKLSDDITLSVGADLVYVNVDDKDGASTDSGLACSDIYAKLGYGDFYVGCTYIAQIDDDVLPDATAEDPWGYDVEWIGAVGWCHTF